VVGPTTFKSLFPVSLHSKLEKVAFSSHFLSSRFLPSLFLFNQTDCKQIFFYGKVNKKPLILRG
jgi:hypothetical protein